MLMLMNCGNIIAESDAVDIALLFLGGAMGVGEDDMFTTSAPKATANEVTIWFDFRDGWHTVMVLHDGKIKTTMPMDSLKVLNGCCNLLALLPQIQAQMPQGVDVSFTVAFTDENIQVITLENYTDYLWY
jgi:hypothetical protein